MDKLERRINEIEQGSDKFITSLLEKGFWKFDTLLRIKDWQNRDDTVNIGRTKDRQGIFPTSNRFGRMDNIGGNTFRSPSHRLQNGDDIVLSTTGDLPTGLDSYPSFYVRDRTPDTFKLAAIPGGSAISFSGSGYGIHFWRLI